MPTYKITFIRNVTERHTVIVDRESQQQVMADYVDGTLPWDDEPECEIDNEHTLKIVLMPDAEETSNDMD